MRSAPLLKSDLIPAGTPDTPSIIQGGMGAAVSGWQLARAVALYGQLGVVSGTGLDTIFVRRLQDGDAGGHLRRAASRFPIPGVAERVIHRFFLEEGRAGRGYALLSQYGSRASLERNMVTVLANFVEVFLAKEGHDGRVGINLLTKIQPPTLPSLYGAMLAGVDYVLMGAGIPREIPGTLDLLARHEAASIRYDVLGGGEPVFLNFDPGALWAEAQAPLVRPKFLAIVASNSLATMLARKATGSVNGFVVEGPTAGGHNAPPRGEPRFNHRGEPLYGDRDAVALDALRELGPPFWLAGGTGSPEGLAASLRGGAAGIQVGTLFAFCDESGLLDEYKRAVLRAARAGLVDVITDPRASPTGYPFKVVQAVGLPMVDERRERVCDLGYLRAAYRRPDGRVAYRCPGEPVKDYLMKGGSEEDTVGRRCLCNALMANVGMGQQRDGNTVEPPLLTSGDDLLTIQSFLCGRESYSAADVLDYLLGVDASARSASSNFTIASVSLSQ